MIPGENKDLYLGGHGQLYLLIRHKESKTPYRFPRHLRSQIPDGFEYGYGGSGPAQLALAIMLDFTGDRDMAVKLYQDFKWEFISKLPNTGAAIKGSEIACWVNKKCGPKQNPAGEYRGGDKERYEPIT